MAQPFTPRVTQPGVLRFEDWTRVHAKDVTRMVRFLRVRMGCVGRDKDVSPWGTWDWAGVRRSLERYVFANSANRFLSYQLVK